MEFSNKSDGPRIITSNGQGSLRTHNCTTFIDTTLCLSFLPGMDHSRSNGSKPIDIHTNRSMVLSSSSLSTSGFLHRKPLLGPFPDLPDPLLPDRLIGLSTFKGIYDPDLIDLTFDRSTTHNLSGFSHKKIHCDFAPWDFPMTHLPIGFLLEAQISDKWSGSVPSTNQWLSFFGLK
jgi:hypothetical protein